MSSKPPGETLEQPTSQRVNRCGAAKPVPPIEKFLVFNDTDGILVHPGPVTRCSAVRLIRQFRGRFREQGFYLTARRERVNPEEVQLSVVPADSEQACELEPEELEEGWKRCLIG